MKVRLKRVVRVTIGLLLAIPYIALLGVSWVGEQADKAINFLWFASDKANSWSNRK